MRRASDLLHLVPSYESIAAAHGMSAAEYDQHVRAEHAASQASERFQRAAQRRQTVLRRIGSALPRRDAELVANEALEATTAVTGVRHWLSGSKAFLFLIGGTGTGKTLAAVWGAIQAEESQIVHATRLGRAYEPWSSDRGAAIEPLDMGVKFLVVDDLGLEALEERRSAAAIEDIAHARQGAHDDGTQLRTVYTTNLNVEALRARYSERVLSRWRASSDRVAIAGTDRRGRD